MKPHALPRGVLSRGKKRRARGGFTLVEILVALLAGLVVAISVMALSREATATFHEEVRSAAAEAAARSAMDRLRADLQRASYMSTANIREDLSLAHAPGTTFFSRLKTERKGLRRLAGIRLEDGGSATATPLSAIESNKLSPDAVEIGGNFTTTDAYVVRYVAEPNGSCQRVWLALDSAPLYRLGTTAAVIATALRSAFQPVPVGKSTQFMARIVDDTGHTQYAPTCPSSDAAGIDGGVPYVDLEVGTDGYAVLSAKQTQTLGGAAGLGVGRMTINPVQIVRWELTGKPSTQYDKALNSGADTSKYDLVRTFVDASGNVVADTQEVVAEYAIDLKLAFTVERGDVNAVNTQHEVLAFEDAKNASEWAYDVSNASIAQRGPQRIRSVRARLVTRAEYADRITNVPVTPANTGNQRFLYRYCVSSDVNECKAGDKEVWARARTVTTEVSLPNQSRAFF